MYLFCFFCYFLNVKYGACCKVANLLPLRSKLFKVYKIYIYCGSMTLTNVCIKGLIKSNNLFEKKKNPLEINTNFPIYFQTRFKR